MDQFSRLHTFGRPYFVCTSAKNNKLVGSISYRMLKMPSYMARKKTPQARDAAVCQAGVVDGVHRVHNALMPPPGRVPLPPRPPHARLLDSTDRAPPSPAMAPASPDWPMHNAWSLLRNISSFLKCVAALSPALRRHSPLSCPVTLIAMDRCSSSATPGLFSAHRQRYSSPFPGTVSRTGPALSPALD